MLAKPGFPCVTFLLPLPAGRRVVLGVGVCTPVSAGFFALTLFCVVDGRRRLKSTGQRLGASGALIHLQRHLSDTQLNQFTMNVANVGDVEAVLCRHGEPLLLTKKYVTSAEREECQRICAADGIITEVGVSEF